MQLIRIETIPMQYHFQVESARLQVTQADNPKINLSSMPAQVRIHTRDIQVQLDTVQMRRSMGLRNNGAVWEDEAQKGVQAAQSATAELSRFGTQVSQIQDGVTVAQLVSQKMFSQPETVTAFIPSVGPSISWQPAQMQLNVEPGKLETDWQINQNVLDYIPGKFQMVIEQYPTVRIEYLGGPNYVPPSANPNYEEPTS